MTLHLTLAEALARDAGDRLAAPVQLNQDALILLLRNGVTLEVRCAAPDEYAFGWRWGDAQLRIDTAPLHPELATFPNHLHDADGTLRADPITHPDRAPRDNLLRLLDALESDPLLGEA